MSQPNRREPWALAGLAVSMLLPSLGTSIANVALPSLADAFDASFRQVQWIVIAYLLASTTVLVAVGRLGDRIGRRRMLLAGIVLFTAASVLCGAAAALWLLIAARMAQGLGAAIMMANTMALVGQAVPKARTGSAMGLLGTMGAMGTALGPSLGGVLDAEFGWRAIFLINVPLGMLAFLLACRRLPADRVEQGAERPGLDAAGALLLAVTLGAYAVAMAFGRGGFGFLDAALLLATVLAGGLFLRVEARAASPLIPPAMFRDPILSAGFALSMLIATVLMATLVVGPFYLSRGLGLGSAPLGVVMSVGPLAAALAGVPAGRMVDRFGAQRMILGGLVGVGIGCCLLAIVPARFGIPGYIAAIVVTTACYALFQAANNTAVVAAVAPERRGVVSGILTLSRNLGLITGASAMGAVFALASGTSDMATASPEAVAAGMRVTFGGAAAAVGMALVLVLPRFPTRRSAVEGEGLS